MKKKQLSNIARRFGEDLKRFEKGKRKTIKKNDSQSNFAQSFGKGLNKKKKRSNKIEKQNN